MYSSVLSECKANFFNSETCRHTTRGREGGGQEVEDMRKSKKVIFVCISKMNFWAYLSCSDADIRDQTASKNIETVTRRTNSRRHLLKCVCVYVCVVGGDLR